MVKEIDLTKTYWYWELKLSSNYRAWKKTLVCEVKIATDGRNGYSILSLDGKLCYRRVYGSQNVSFLYETKEEAIEGWNEYIQTNLEYLTNSFETKSAYLRKHLIQSSVKKIKRGTSENP